MKHALRNIRPGGPLAGTRGPVVVLARRITIIKTGSRKINNNKPRRLEY